MAQVISFVDYVPAARYDETPWTQARIEEAASQEGVWGVLETVTLDPVDADPASPVERNITTALASDTMGMWYRLVWLDQSGAQSPTLPLFNGPDETLDETALCTEEDVRRYLNIKAADLTPDDEQTIIRLANAASETFADESQRLWIVPEAANPQTRVYVVDEGEIDHGYVRIDDARSVDEITYGDQRDLEFAWTELASGWYTHSDPDEPITRIGFEYGPPFSGGHSISVTGDFGWAGVRADVPEKVRQAVIYTAAEWYARDVENFSGTFSLGEGRISLPRVLPDQVQATAESYRRWRIA